MKNIQCPQCGSKDIKEFKERNIFLYIGLIFIFFSDILNYSSMFAAGLVFAILGLSQKIDSIKKGIQLKCKECKNIWEYKKSS